MPNQTGSSADDTGLTPEDYERFFLPSTTWVVSVFLVILVILSALFWWFQRSMRANSNQRVTEAVNMLERFDSSSANSEKSSSALDPLTFEIEEMRAETKRDRLYLMEALAHDSYPRRIQSQLKQRFLEQSFYGDLPNDWKETLPSELKKWKQEKDRQQIQRLRRVLARIPTILETHRENLSRIQQIRQQMQLPGEFKPVEERFRETRSIFERRLNQLDETFSQINPEQFTDRKYPQALFYAIRRMLDPMFWMELQYRRLSGLSSAPASLIYAEQALKDALRIDPRNPEAYYQLGQTYQRLGLERISGEYYLRALRVSRGESYHRRSTIVEMMERNRKENPNSSRARYELGWAYYETDNESGALKQLLDVIENECNLKPLSGIEKRYREGGKKQAMYRVDQVIGKQCEKKSMELTLAQKRLRYILEGEPPYYRLTYF